jgi:hypothetical protein
MSQIDVTDVAPDRISKDGKCIYCCSQLKQCPVCSEWFSSGRDDKEACGDRCRTRKHRQKIRDELELDDE